jgi:hypothetical protein
MRHGDLSTRFPTRDAAGPVLAHDRDWAPRRRTAYGAAAGALAATILLDAIAGTLTAPRAAVWLALSALLLAVLLPPCTTAGDGWLAVRGLLRTRRVRTDLLVSARFDGAVDRRVLLRDAFGARVAVDPAVLIANPFLWHQLDTGAHHSRAAGLLPDRSALRELSEAIDIAGSRTLLSSSGLL